MILRQMSWTTVSTMLTDSKFDIPAIASVVKLKGQYNLELFMAGPLPLRTWHCLSALFDDDSG